MQISIAENRFFSGILQLSYCLILQLIVKDVGENAIYEWSIFFLCAVSSYTLLERVGGARTTRRIILSFHAESPCSIDKISDQLYRGLFSQILLQDIVLATLRILLQYYKLILLQFYVDLIEEKKLLIQTHFNINTTTCRPECLEEGQTSKRTFRA